MAEAPAMLVDWLTAKFPQASRQTLKQMVSSGRVTVDGKPARKLKEPLPEGAQVRVGNRTPLPPQRVCLPDGVRIVFEDADVMVVYKPPGLLTSTTPGEKRLTLIAALRTRDPAARIGVIHRLDKEARGLLVFSKNHDAYRHLKKQFLEHTVQRQYTAVVEGVSAPRARIESRLIERRDGQMRSTTEPGKGQRAITEYEMLQHNGKRALLRVTLHTGRKHQIRAHLSQRNTPIVGDTVYGNDRKSEHELMLAATHLAFTHPRTSKSMVFDDPIPPHMQELVS